MYVAKVCYAFHFLQINIFCRKSKYSLFAFLTVGKDLVQVQHSVSVVNVAGPQ